ncbi:alpha/beta fold hydrolase [Streptomyces sp. NPDC002004]
MSEGAGRRNWLFVPGGPGLGSESVLALASAAGVPGTVWLVDLPGDGSNRGVPQVPHTPYEGWPGVLVEAVQELDEVVMVGHSTGGMYMLSVPALEERLAGMVLVSSAPHADWRQAFARWATEHPIPAVDRAAQDYAADPNDRTLRALTLAAAPWNFTPHGLAGGRAVLEGLTYCHEAVAWSDLHFDESYRARWKPRTLPTLIISGAQDHVVDQSTWRTDPDFHRPHILRRTVDDGGHFPWIENPTAVRTAFTDLVDLLDGGRSRGR